MPERRRFAVFIDFDNIAIGTKASQNRPFRYEHVLNWIRSRGEVLTQVAYGSWSSHANARQIQSELAAHGVRMEHLETTPSGGKNGADIALVLEALELVFTQEHIDSFCIVSGDSDFLPLVHKLKRYNKRVYICAAQDTISNNLRRNCNEFISYENLLRARDSRNPDISRPAPSARRKPRYKQLEEALPYVREAIRDMDRHGAMPFMNELSEHIAYREPDLDPRSFNCEGFKELIYRMLEAGYLWRQPVGPQMFCVAVSDERDPSPSRRRERSRRDDRPREYSSSDEPRSQPGFEAPWGLETSGSTSAPAGPSETVGRRRKPARQETPRSTEPEVSLPQGEALRTVVSVLEEARQRIESEGQTADPGLLYDTVLGIDPKFRSYGSRRTAFRALLDALEREGQFSLSEVDGQVVGEIPANDKEMRVPKALPGATGEAAEKRAEPQPNAEKVAARIAAARANARAEPLSPEALRKARAATPGDSAPTTPRVPSSDLEFKVSGPVAQALTLIVPVLRANKDLGGPGLSRDQLKDAVLEVQPSFKCASYGIRTFRDLFARARNEGFLETRDDDGQGMRYFGTERLSQVPLSEA